MKITKRQLRQIIKEAKGYTDKYDDDSALKGDQSKLPDALQKSIIDKVVDDREDADQADETNEGTELSDMPDSWQQILGDCLVENAASARQRLLDSEYTQDSSTVSHPYGRHRGDVRSNLVYKRKDGEPISDRDLAVLKAVEENNHPLGGMYTHSLSDDGMSVNVSYYKHTAG